MWRQTRRGGGLRNVTSCDKDGEGVKKIIKFVWRNLWLAPNILIYIVLFPSPSGSLCKLAIRPIILWAMRKIAGLYKKLFYFDSFSRRLPNVSSFARFVEYFGGNHSMARASLLGIQHLLTRYSREVILFWFGFSTDICN